jgi:hypothetical protein
MKTMNAAVWFSSLAGLAALAATPAGAQPSRVIILRHAEKLNAYALCDLGRERADALAKLRLGQAPESWPDTNYDYFWIVDYAPGNPNPVRFQAVKQTFTSPFNTIPAPDWDGPEPKHIEAVQEVAETLLVANPIRVDLAM